MEMNKRKCLWGANICCHLYGPNHVRKHIVDPIAILVGIASPRIVTVVS